MGHDIAADERLSRDSTRDRITLLGVGHCGLVMAIAIPHVYGTGGMPFALAYGAARIRLWLRYVPQYRPRVLTSLGLSATVIGPMLVVGALLPDAWREIVWCVGALVDLGTVAVTGRLHRLIHYDHSHLMERFGPFVLIALAEQIVDLSLPLARQTDNIHPLELLAVGVSFVVVCTLWWTYFDHSNAAITSAIAGSREHVVLSRQVTHGHFGVVGGIVCIAGGVRTDGDEAVGVDDVHPSQPAVGRGDLMLMAMVYMRYAMSKVWRVARIAAIAVPLVLHVSLLVPGIVATALLAAVLSGLVTLEKRWPALSTQGGDRVRSDAEA